MALFGETPTNESVVNESVVAAPLWAGGVALGTLMIVASLVLTFLIGSALQTRSIQQVDFADMPLNDSTWDRQAAANPSHDARHPERDRGSLLAMGTTR